MVSNDYSTWYLTCFSLVLKQSVTGNATAVHNGSCFATVTSVPLARLHLAFSTDEDGLPQRQICSIHTREKKTFRSVREDKKPS